MNQTVEAIYPFTGLGIYYLHMWYRPQLRSVPTQYGNTTYCSEVAGDTFRGSLTDI